MFLIEIMRWKIFVNLFTLSTISQSTISFSQIYHLIICLSSTISLFSSRGHFDKNIGLQNLGEREEREMREREIVNEMGDER